MTPSEAARRLLAMYDYDNQSITPHLFGIRYATDLAPYSVAELAAIAAAAGLPESYGGEIRRGVRMAQFVAWKGASHAGL